MQLVTACFFFVSIHFDIPVNPINIFPDVDIDFVWDRLLTLTSFPPIFSSSIIFVLISMNIEAYLTALTLNSIIVEKLSVLIVRVYAREFQNVSEKAGECLTSKMLAITMLILVLDFRICSHKCTLQS